MPIITLTDGTKQSLPSAESISASNCGTPGVWRFDSGQAGAQVVITALIHGNEVCGAHAAWQLVQSSPKPAQGRITVVFCNIEAYTRLDDANKADRRFVDEDLNRVWGRVDNEGSYELRRAREVLPFVQDADVLLDLHSMTEAAPALGLVGLAWKNVDFANRVGFPALLVRDAGHASGLRLIDRKPFSDAGASQVAMLVECGQHFSREALVAAEDAVRRVVDVYVSGKTVDAPEPQQVIDVTEAVTIQTEKFEFTREWGNMSVVPVAGTLIARDGEREVRTTYDDTYMIMPTSPRHRRPGLTAVRFGRRAQR